MGFNNTETKEQIRRWLEKAIKEATNPSPMVRLKKLREKKRKKIVKKYGF